MTAPCLPIPAGAAPAAPAALLAPSSTRGGQTGDEFPALMFTLLSGATPEAPETAGTPVPSRTGAQAKSNSRVPPASDVEPEKPNPLAAGFPIFGLAPPVELPRLPLAEPGLPGAATAPGEPLVTPPAVLGAVAPAAGPCQLESEPAPSDASGQPLAAQLPAPEGDLPGTPKRAAAKTELAFAARLVERAPASTAAAASKLVATPSKDDTPVVRLPEPAPDANTPSVGSTRLAADRSPDKPGPEHAGAKVEAADGHVQQLVPVASEPAERTSAGPVAGGRAPSRLDPQSALTGPPDLQPARAATRPQPVRELSLVIPQPAAGGNKAEAVEVRLVDRAGQVHVAVRTGDARLGQSLGAELGDLVTQLEHSGYRTETWRPAASTPVAGGVSGIPDASAQQLRDGANREGYSGSGPHNQGGNESDSSNRQGQQQEQARPQWLEMLEESFPPQANSDRSMIYDIVN